MTRRLLDLFSGGGGAGAGYAAAGWDVTGVDHEPMPEYPFRFVQADALQFVRDHGHRFDAVHASPPCQSSSALTKGTNRGREYPDLIAPTREALHRTGLPSVLENVAGARIRHDVMLCGEMFGLDVLRHRYFELGGWTMDNPDHPPHRGRVKGMRHGQVYDGPYWAVYGDGGGKGSVADWQHAMGIGWIHRRKVLAQAIPPDFTRYLGAALAAA